MTSLEIPHPPRAPRSPQGRGWRSGRPALLLLAPLVVAAAFAAPLAVSAALDGDGPAAPRATDASLELERAGATPLEPPKAVTTSTLGEAAALPDLRRPPRPRRTAASRAPAPAPATPAPTAAPEATVAPAPTAVSPPPAPAPQPAPAPTEAPARQAPPQSFDDSGPASDPTFDSSG